MRAVAFLTSYLVAFSAIGKPGAAKVFWEGDSGGFHVVISEDDIRATELGGSKKQTFSLRREFDAKVKECEKWSAEAIDDLVNIELDLMVAYCAGSANPLSLIGRFLTVEVSSEDDTPGAAHPSSVASFRTIDLANPDREVKLSDLFSESDALAALKKDKVVKRHLEGKHSPKSMGELLQALDGAGPCEYGFFGNWADNFAIWSLEAKGKAAVRLGLSHGCEVARGSLTQLGILLDAPKGLTPAFTMKEAKKLFPSPIGYSWERDLKPLVDAKRQAKKK